MPKAPPLTIYLPSSGGNTGSRIAPVPTIRRSFPLSRYSIQEDGSLVVRVRHTNQANAHPHPSTSTSVRTTSNSDPNPTVELLKTLVPALVNDPSSFEESLASICAAHDIDKSAVSAVTQEARRKSNRPIERTKTLDRSTPPVVPSSSTSTATSLVPFRQERPSSSGLRGTTIWYTTQSYADIARPPDGILGAAGALYIHKNITTSTRQIWVFDREAQWTAAANDARVSHPTVSDRVLSIRSDGTPHWVTTAGYANLRSRKARV